MFIRQYVLCTVCVHLQVQEWVCVSFLASYTYARRPAGIQFEQQLRCNPKRAKEQQQRHSS